jgi:opacity protein-like surface antigen
MNRGVLGRAAAALLLFVSLAGETAVAAETTANNERGFYLGASASYVEQDAQGEGEMIVAVGLPFGFVARLTPNQVELDDTQAGWNVTLGYQINRYLAAEVAYYDFGEAAVVERYAANIFPLPLNITVRSNVKAYGPGVSLLGTLPLTSSLNVFARGGVLFLDQEIQRQMSTFRSSRRTGDEAWMAGAGAQWWFASRWAARLEYQLTDDIDLGGSVLNAEAGTTKIEQISLSVLFDF